MALFWGLTDTCRPFLALVRRNTIGLSASLPLFCILIPSCLLALCGLRILPEAAGWVQFPVLPLRALALRLSFNFAGEIFILGLDLARGCRSGENKHTMPKSRRLPGLDSEIQAVFAIA